MGGLGRGIIREGAAGGCGGVGGEPDTASVCHGLKWPAGRRRSLDGSTGGRRSRKTQVGSPRGKRNHSHSLAQPRSQAVAGKKNGGWPLWVTNTTPKRKTCWRCSRPPHPPPPTLFFRSEEHTP